MYHWMGLSILLNIFHIIIFAEVLTFVIKAVLPEEECLRLGRKYHLMAIFLLVDGYIMLAGLMVLAKLTGNFPEGPWWGEEWQGNHGPWYWCWGNAFCEILNYGMLMIAIIFIIASNLAYVSLRLRPRVSAFSILVVAFVSLYLFGKYFLWLIS
jgi:hypothetical protein